MEFDVECSLEEDFEDDSWRLCSNRGGNVGGDRDLTLELHLPLRGSLVTEQGLEVNFEWDLEVGINISSIWMSKSALYSVRGELKFHPVLSLDWVLDFKENFEKLVSLVVG